MQPKGGYTVGYAKPPKQTQFKKGLSGNPHGRPRGAKNLATLLCEALDKKITTVTESGDRRKITKREAMITQLVNRSAQADLKATLIVLGMMQEIDHSTGGSAGPPPSATRTGKC